MSTSHDLITTDLAYSTRDRGATGTVACWDGRPPKVDDYLILANGPNKAARYKVTEVDVPMNVDPPTMWIAKVRHAPSTRP